MPPRFPIQILQGKGNISSQLPDQLHQLVIEEPLFSSVEGERTDNPPVLVQSNTG